MSRFRIPGLISGIVFAAFVAYAFLSPAIYRASAAIAIAPAAATAELPAPLEAARRLHEAVLDRTVLEQLSRTREPGTTAKTVGEIQSALEIDTSDSKTFSISFRDGDAERAQRVCNQLARHAVERAPAALSVGQAVQDRSLETERQRRTDALTRFVTAHPELMAESSPQKGSPESDRMTLALKAERTRIEQKLLGGGEGSRAKSDNPYDDPPDPAADPAVLRRRMNEIDTALQIRQKAAGAANAGAGSKLTPEVLSEWRRLVQALAEVGADKPAATAAQASVKARLLQDAPLPGSPIDPNRPLLILFGALSALTLGSLAFFWTRLGPAIHASGPYPAVGGSGPYPALPPSPPEIQVPRLPAPAPTPTPPPPPEEMPRQPRAATLAYGTPAYRPDLPDPPANGENVGPVGENHGGTVIMAPAHQATPAPGRLEPLPTFAIGGRERVVDARVETESTVAVAEVVRDSDPPQVSHHKNAENSWENASNAPADPKFAAVLDAAAEAVRASDPRVNASEQPPAAVVLSEPPPAIARPFNPEESRQPSRVPRSKVTQRLGSFPGSELSALPGMPMRASTPAGGYSHVSVKPPPSDDWVVTVVKGRSEWRHDPELLPESRRELRDQLFQHAVDHCFVVAVSAVAEAGDGKSRVAAELALALAESGHPRILLIEGNFHQPNVHRYMRVDMPTQMGFSQQLHARISGGRERWTVVECQRSLHVLAEGLMRSPGLLLSKQFESCLSDLRSYYDLIVIDGPPVALEVDCRALDSVTDGLLIVCPSGGSPGLLRARNAFSDEKRFFAVVPT